MAGEWLKFESDTPEKQEVFSITVLMGWPDPDLTVGKLMKIWRWFDRHTINGNADRVTLALLDGISGVSGFAQAMCDVGWLVCTDSGVSLPNFDRHTGKTAKDRCLTAKRVANHKANAKGNAAVVSDALPREEKRREEEKNKERAGESPDAHFPDPATDGNPPETTEKRARRRGTPEDEKCARWLYGQLLNVLPSAQEPNWNGWSDDVRLMRERDNRTHHDIAQLFLWATKDAFWCRNILSPSKLREKWDQLQVNRQQPVRNAPSALVDQKFRPNTSDYSSSEAAMAATTERHGIIVDMNEDIKF